MKIPSAFPVFFLYQLFSRVSMCHASFYGANEIIDRRVASKVHGRPLEFYNGRAPFRYQQENEDIDDLGLYDDGTVRYNPSDPPHDQSNEIDQNEIKSSDLPDSTDQRSIYEYESIPIIEGMNHLWSDYVELKLKLETMDDQISPQLQNEIYDKITMGLSSLSIMLGDLSKEMSNADQAYEDEDHQDELRAYHDDLVIWQQNLDLLKKAVEDPTSGTEIDFQDTTYTHTEWPTVSDIPLSESEPAHTDFAVSETTPDAPRRQAQGPPAGPEFPTVEVPLINDMDTGNDSFMEQSSSPDNAPIDLGITENFEDSHGQQPDNITSTIKEEEEEEETEEDEALPPIIPSSGILSASGFDSTNPVEHALLQMSEDGVEMEKVQDDPDRYEIQETQDEEPLTSFLAIEPTEHSTEIPPYPITGQENDALLEENAPEREFSAEKMQDPDVSLLETLDDPISLMASGLRENSLTFQKTLFVIVGLSSVLAV